jgi:hypothetical protein
VADDITSMREHVAVDQHVLDVPGHVGLSWVADRPSRASSCPSVSIDPPLVSVDTDRHSRRHRSHALRQARSRAARQTSAV